MPQLSGQGVTRCESRDGTDARGGGIAYSLSRFSTSVIHEANPPGAIIYSSRRAGFYRTVDSVRLHLALGTLRSRGKNSVQSQVDCRCAVVIGPVSNEVHHGAATRNRAAAKERDAFSELGIINRSQCCAAVFKRLLDTRDEDVLACRRRQLLALWGLRSGDCGAHELI